MKVCVIICSHGRPADLSRCLASVARTLNRSDFSVLVCINEQEAGEFQKVAAAGARSDPSARFIHVPQIGLSRARNEGMQAANDASWIVFLDDDVTVPTGWGRSLLESLSRIADDVGVVTGRVLPIWEKTVIRSRKWRELLSLVERTEAVTGVTVPGVGAFFCVRSRAALSANGFHENLGRTGTNLAGGEDMLLFARVVQLGYLMRFDPVLQVNHHIPESRCSRSWIKNRAFCEGVTQRQLRLATGHASSRVEATISWLKSSVAGLLFLVTQRSDLLVSSMWHLGFARAAWHPEGASSSSGPPRKESSADKFLIW